MFGKIAAFEFRYQVKSPVFWVGAGLFFLLTFGSVASSNVQIGMGSAVHKNAPFAIAMTTLIMAVLYMFVTTALVANVVIRDDDTGYAPIVRSTRVRKFDYLYGRFVGAFAAAALSFLVVPLGILLGSVMPWVDPETLGPLLPQGYVFAYVVLALPALFFSSAVFFALATATRSMMWTYVGLIAFLVLRVILSIVLTKQGMEQAAALFEPFGGGAYGLATRYWTTTERNSLTPPIQDMLLWNRVLWLAISFAFLGGAYFLLSFRSAGARVRKKARARTTLESAASSVPEPSGAPPVDRTAARPVFGARTAWVQLWARTRLDMGQVFRSPAYFVLMGLGVLLSVAVILLATDVSLYGGQLYPVVRLMVTALKGGFATIAIVIAVYYSGELVWRDHERRVHEIIDATPVPDWFFIVPKILAIALVLVSTLVLSVLVALAVQAFKGWYHLDLGKYLWWYVIPDAVNYLLIAVLAVFVQALVPHKFIGWAVMVVYLIARIVLDAFGLEHNLYIFAGGPEVPLSDMNGTGIAGAAAWWFRGYWSSVALVLLVLAYALWRRGTQTQLSPRLRRLPARLRGGAGVLLALSILAAVGTGGFIYLNTNVWNHYRSHLDEERWLADYEKALLHYETLPQPKITDVSLAIDLHPRSLQAVTHGVYVFENKTNAPIRELHVRFARDLKVLGLSVEGARPSKTFERFNYRIFTFDTPMQPGERRRLSFQTAFGQKGFKNDGNITAISANGTFINNFELSPLLGMDRSLLLQDRTKRRKYGLPAELRMAKLEDQSARRFNLLRKDSDWVNADITVTTDADQIPIAPGYRVSETVSNGRRTARFRTEAPINHFFSIQSARYALKRENYKGVELSVYYYPGHPWNVDRMIHALKAGLDYDQANFSPYQFRQVRILEFPAPVGGFAQSFANTLAWSEGLGFTFDIRNPEKIDMVTYVAAHELGHQWWAHQVIGGKMQGVTMLDESFAQYSALMAMEKLYGPDQIRKFLKYELDAYLRARGSDSIEELALNRVEDQQYIHYRKGSLVMYRAKDDLGEDTVNRALRRLLHDYAFKGAPYPTSMDFIGDLRQETGPDPRKQQLITDLFEKITLYDLKTTKAVSKKRPDGRYDVTVSITAGKEYDDGRGKPIAKPPMDELIDVGVFDAAPDEHMRLENGHVVHFNFGPKNVLFFKKLPIHAGQQSVTVTVDRPPRWAGVDPYNKVIDRNSDDNWARVGS